VNIKKEVTETFQKITGKVTKTFQKGTRKMAVVKEKFQKYKNSSIVNFFTVLGLLIVFSIWLNLTVTGAFANWKTIEVLNDNIQFYATMQQELKTQLDFSPIESSLSTYFMIIDSVQQRYYNMLYYLPFLIIGMIYIKKKYNLQIPSDSRILIKTGDVIFPIMFTVFFAMSMVFFSSASGMDVSNKETIVILLAESISSSNPDDVLVLVQKFLFDNSQDYHKELVNAFYFAGIGAFFLIAYFVQIAKGKPNVLSSLIFYSAILVILYWFVILNASVIHDTKEFVPSMFETSTSETEIEDSTLSSTSDTVQIMTNKTESIIEIPP